jgi:diguanylate cyclase (GGDEF)-like protein
MLHARTSGAVYRELVEGIREGLGFTGAVLAYLDQDGGLVFPPAPEGPGAGFPGFTVRRGAGAGSFFLSLLDECEPRFQPGPPTAGREEYEAVCGGGGSLLLPIAHRGWAGDDGEEGAAEAGESARFRPALLVLRPAEGGRAVGPGTIPLVLSLLNEAETALEMADMYRKLRALSVTDGLTGLLNHREFYERLDREVDRAKRYAHTLSLLILDVDDFKRYNDRFGHPAGDEALRVLASLLRQSARGTDILARYGGEEFAVILPESSNGGAMLMAERIRSSLAGANLSPIPDEVVHLTVSIGIYTSEAGGTSVDTIVSMADEAAYRAKAEGKNQVILRSGL